jgi:hypothetical protein
MMSNLNPRYKNPLTAPRTSLDFLTRWPGATCRPFHYAPGLSVFVLRLADGMVVATGYREAALWDKGMGLLENMCLAAQKRASATVAAMPRAPARA